MKRLRVVWITLALLTVPLIAYAQSKPLPETYVSDEVTTFRYPTGWTIDAEQPGLVIVTTKDHAIQLGSDFMSPGEAAVIVLFSNADDAYLREYFEENSPTAMMNHLIQRLLVPNLRGDLKFTALETVEFANFPAVRSSTTFQDNNFSLILADRGNGLYSLVIAITAASEFNKYEPKLLTIAESVHYQPRSQ